MQITQKITPFLSYKSQAQEAAEFYVSVFPNSKILHTVNNHTTGSVLTVEFQLAGMNFVALNTGEDWPFTDAISLCVGCDSQEEIDTYWELLSAGGQEVQCGWLKDKFGVSWQITPNQIMTWLHDPDPAKSQRMLAALMQMIKLDIATLEAAYNGN